MKPIELQEMVISSYLGRKRLGVSGIEINAFALLSMKVTNLVL